MALVTRAGCFIVEGELDVVSIVNIAMQVMAFDVWATGTACYDIFHARNCSARPLTVDHTCVAARQGNVLSTCLALSNWLAIDSLHIGSFALDIAVHEALDLDLSWASRPLTQACPI